LRHGVLEMERLKITQKMLEELKVEDLEFDWKDDPDFPDTHYSEKTGHKKRGEVSKQKKKR